MNWNRLLSGIVGTAYLIAAGIIDGGEGFLRMAIFLIPVLACIWFGSAMGSVMGWFGGFNFVNRQSPGCAVVAVGWVLLFLPVIIVVVMALNS